MNNEQKFEAFGPIKFFFYLFIIGDDETQGVTNK